MLHLLQLTNIQDDVLIFPDVLEELIDGGSKEEINNFEEDDLIEPLEYADVDQAVDNADEDDLENINKNLFWKYFKSLTS